MAVKPKQGYTIDMTSGSLLKKMLRFAVPLALSTLLQLLFNAADLVVVSRFAGDNAMAAVGANSTLTKLMVNMFNGVSVGANVLAARERGAGDREEVYRTVHTSMALSLVAGAIVLLIGLLGSDRILRLMQIPENILPQASLYLKIYFIGIPANLIYNFGAALLRSVGDTKRPLYYLTFAGVVNVLLNLVLVIVFHLDVAGVAVATAASQIISAYLVVRCLMQEESDIRLDIKALQLRGDKLKEILRVGLPAGVQASVFSLSNVIIQSSFNSFGEVVIAGHSAANNIQGFVHCIDTALSSTVLSFTSQNLGAKKYDRVPRVLLTAYGCLAITFSVVISAVLHWGELLLGIYSQTPEVIAVGMVEFRIMLSTLIICGAMNVTASAMRGLGKSFTSMVVSLIGVCGFRMVWILTIFQIPAYHTIESLYMSYPISWTATLEIDLCCWVHAIRKLRKEHGGQEKLSA